MLKVLGCVCMIAGCVGWGESRIREEKSRVRHLHELIRLIRRIQEEIRYGKRTLPEICLLLSEYGDSWYGPYFKRIYEQLQERNGTGFEAVWAGQMALCFQRAPLREEEKDVLRRLPEYLGLQEETSQAVQIGQSVDLLERKCRQAEDTYENKAKVIRSVSILAGLFLAILLL